MITQPVQLDVGHVDVLLEHLGVQEPPHPFEIPYHGTDRDERARQHAQVFTELADGGLAGVDGQRRTLDPDLARALLLLARPALSVDAIFLDGDDQIRVLVASDGRIAARGVQRGTGFQLHPVQPGALAEAVVELLPPVDPGGGQSVRLTVDELREGSVEPVPVLVPASARRGTAPGRHEVLRAFLARPRTGGGQVTARGVDRLGKRRRSPTLNWQDQAGSRTLIAADERGLILNRIDQAAMVSRIRALIDHVQPARTPSR